ncbi:MAG TPA: nuclear transport factor 2 family protein [Burkholderiales bacterium]|nr:nuclear transport factor 2 family protein [Burkholderiales bacterium]
MTTDLAQLIDTYCQAWSEPDAQRRAQLLAQVWSEGATYTDPTVHAAGSGELLAHIAQVVARRPGARIVRTSAVDEHHGLARFTWRLVEADGTPRLEGIDFVELSSDVRIRRIVGFFGPLAG